MDQCITSLLKTLEEAAIEYKLVDKARAVFPMFLAGTRLGVEIFELPTKRHLALFIHLPGRVNTTEFAKARQVIIKINSCMATGGYIFDEKTRKIAHRNSVFVTGIELTQEFFNKMIQISLSSVVQYVHLLYPLLKLPIPTLENDPAFACK